MQIRYAIAWAMVAIQSTDASNSTSKGDLNGWYPCSEYTFSDEGSSTGQVAQCAVYSAPLCYPGICETPPGVNSEVDVFVKRLPATAADPATTTNVWLLQGGPVEISMATLHSELEGTVNVYTMDHRGTGRSTKPDCVAAQVTTTGSPWDLQIKYGDLASFSVTTAATDLATFISRFTNGAGTIVYGLDPHTPNKYAEYLLNALRGEKKELIAFEYATHGTVMTTPMVADNPWSETCGMKVLASYVRVGGDLERLDKSCVAEMPAFNLTTPDYYLYSYFGTDDAYDGV
ncbi:hypothetical protein AM587_10003153 [Phytophthora nicotianae]|uniref:Uncharacterized protein n=1 Tax=Phytophthora nicotianae TaxID=4792 RepID=A0A0W8CDV9_PHYNI|nr:hypothetical protein AM587_10003153 [Phytophthora nicotianae]